jgi:CheY-like chemotaxis protein
LAIAKDLAELHGATLTATSEGPGRGATFVLTLPVADPSATVQKTAPMTAAPPATRGMPLRGVHVLVADDQLDARELVAAVLEQSGAHVVTAGSADEALALLAHADVDVLVIDVGMPGQDGHALLRRAHLLMSERNRYVPALALTAYASSMDATAAYAAGFEEYLTKPIVPEVLVAAVARLPRRDAAPSSSHARRT